jgi:hypothetical protein
MRTKKKSPKIVSVLRLGQPNTPSWLSSSQLAKESAKIAGTLFSIESTKTVALLPEEPLASEVQLLLKRATDLIECATGGHGRCANSACGCRCHKSGVRTRAKQRMSL